MRTKGAEVGVRTAAVPGLQSSARAVDPRHRLGAALHRRRRQHGGEPARAAATASSSRISTARLPWLTLDADFVDLARALPGQRPGRRLHPRFDRDGGRRGHHGAATSTSFFGSVRVRYFGPRALIEDDTRALEVLDAGQRCRSATSVTNHWSVALDVFNVFDANVSDIDYFYTSRLPGEPDDGVDDIHTHPAEPRSFRGSVTDELRRRSDSVIGFFERGGPVMWPLLAHLDRGAHGGDRAALLHRRASAAAPPAVGRGDLRSRGARASSTTRARLGADSRDFVARVLTYALDHRDVSFSNALLEASNRELQRFNRGLPILDTVDHAGAARGSVRDGHRNDPRLRPARRKRTRRAHRHHRRHRGSADRDRLRPAHRDDRAAPVQLPERAPRTGASGDRERRRASGDAAAEVGTRVPAGARQP